jgi:hypothetical protein
MQRSGKAMSLSTPSSCSRRFTACHFEFSPAGSHFLEPNIPKMEMRMMITISVFRISLVAAVITCVSATQIGAQLVVPSLGAIRPSNEAGGGGALGGMEFVDKVLVVYNSASTESVAVKDYYLANRPGFAGVSVLAISTYDASEVIGQSDFNNMIRHPIVNWLVAHPAKPIHYIVLLRGIPDRMVTDERTMLLASVDYLLTTAFKDLGIRTGPQYGISSTYNKRYDPITYPGTTALVMRLNMGSQAATLAYIDKLKAMGNAMSVPNVVLSAQAAGTGATKYYLDESRAFLGPSVYTIRADRDALVNAGVSGSRITFTPQAARTHITTGTDVLGYETWGTNGHLGLNYAVDGTVTFSGHSGWYLIKTVESNNGQWDKTVSHQSNFVDWFSANAFGGTNYSNTPVGAVCHVDEPSLGGVNSASYLLDWEQGFTFAEAAWDSSRTSNMMAVGDPLVTR